MRPLALIPALVSVCSPALFAITPQQLSTGFGTPPEVVWSTPGADTSRWTFDIFDNKKLWIQWTGTTADQKLAATVTGPGVMEVSLQSQNFMYAVPVAVDGVRSGLPVYGSSAPGHRVQIPAGSHTITWTMPGNAVTMQYPFSVSGVKWTPVPVAPLQVAVASGAVMLDGGWTGQTAWHAGDGAAAWSGLHLKTAENEIPPAPVLGADFSGPGVFRFRAMPRRAAGFYTLDGQPANGIVPDVWTSHLIRVGAGTHRMEWMPGLAVNSNARMDSDMLVDEIGIMPEVDLATALDTPGREWTAVNGEAIGYPHEGAVGGSIVRPGTAGITTAVQAGEHVLISTIGYPSFSLDGAYLPVPASVAGPVTSEGAWYRAVLVIPSSGTLKISGEADVRLDAVEVRMPEADLSLAMGLPAGTLQAAGSSPWIIQPYLLEERYEATADLNAGGADASLAFPVTGPAEIRMVLKRAAGLARVRVQVGGREMWASAESFQNLPYPVTLEVPAGNHTVHLLAESNPVGNASLTLASLAITPVEGRGMFSAALDQDLLWGAGGTWAASASPTFDGTDAIRGSGTLSERRTLRAGFKGPGVFSYRTFANTSPVSGYTPRIVGRGDFQTYQDYYSSQSNPGVWRQTQKEIPPGDHWFEWEITGHPAQHLPFLALDTVSYTAYPVVSLAEALGEPGRVWVNDEGRPWIGTGGERSAAISPLLQPGQTSTISTRAEGPGLLSFRWRRQTGYVIPQLRVNGVAVNIGPSNYGSEDLPLVMVLLEGEGPKDIEWVAAAEAGEAVVEIRDFSWVPWTEVPLATALDVPAEMQPSTNPAAPFTGRPQADAAGGSAARVVLRPDEAPWIEVKVDGPGIFNFDVLGSWLTGNPDESWSQWAEVRVSVDGRPVYQTSQEFFQLTKPLPLWVEGAGPHSVRVELSLPPGVPQPLAVAVDNLQWTPLESLPLDPAWTSSGPDILNFYAGQGKDGAPALVLRQPVRGDEPAWMERTVTGPAVVEWEDIAMMNTGTAEVAVDGAPLQVSDDSSGFDPDRWIRRRLAIPAGEHSIRWQMRQQELRGGPSGDAVGAWRISGLSITTGTMPLVDAMGIPGLPWIITGDGSVANGPAPLGAYWAGERSSLVGVFNTSGQGLRIGWNVGWAVSSWQPKVLWLPAGRGGWLVSDINITWVRDPAVTFVPATTLAEALDLPSADGLRSIHWGGVAVPELAADGQDAAYSLIGEDGQSGEVTLQVAGPARITFRWKHTGTGVFSVVNRRADLPDYAAAGYIPLSSEEGGWVEKEIFVDEGVQLLKWTNSGIEGTNSAEPSEAWVDQVVVQPLASRTLEAAAGVQGAVVLSQAGELGWSFDEALWGPAYHRAADGTWTSAIASQSGYQILKATVTGPAMLEFRTRITGYEGADRLSTTLPPYQALPREAPVWNYISIRLDGTEKIRITGEAWSAQAIFIPAGTHEVTWQSLLASWQYTDESTPPVFQPLRAWYDAKSWVDDIRRTGVADHYAAWAGHFTLADGEDGPRDDADGDGVLNLMEYALGTDPRDPESSPPGIGAHFNPASTDRPGYLRVPYASPFALLRVQSSPDLFTWTPLPAPAGTVDPLAAPDVPGWPASDGTMHTYILPSAAQPESKLFYRLEVELPE